MAVGFLSGCDQVGAPSGGGDDGEDSLRLNPQESVLFNINNISLSVNDNAVLGYTYDGTQRGGQWRPNGDNGPEIQFLFAAGLWLTAEQEGSVRADLVFPASEHHSNFTATFDDARLGVYSVTREMLDDPLLMWPDELPTDAEGEPLLYGSAMTYASLRSSAPQGAEAIHAHPTSGLRYTQAVFGFERAELRDVIFIRYDISNTTSAPLTDVRLGLRIDTDLRYGTKQCWHENRSAYDFELALSYTYPSEHADETVTCQVPVAGFVFLETPESLGATAHTPVLKDRAPDYLSDFYEGYTERRYRPPTY